MSQSNFFNRLGDKSLTENNRQWNELIEKIVQGEVVPVIGPEFLAEDLNNPEKWMNVHQALINMLAENYNIQPNHNSFSELLYDDRFPASERKNVYQLLGECFKPELSISDTKEIPKNAYFRPSKLLIKLLRICKFRFVITTSFTPLVEYAMREIYGERGVKVLNFNNNPIQNDDIKSIDDIQKPSVYYMFGRVCDGEKRYVVSDSDMLAFCRSWLSDAPNTLVSILKTKYLLILGNNYSDWLCRFIWYSMKTELDSTPKGMMVNDNESLLQFMKRIDAFAQRNPQAVIDKIETMVMEKVTLREQIKFHKPDIDTDVFLSYSRRDSVVVKKLYDELTEKGLRVWYDKENLGIGDKFMEEIKYAIRKTRIFIPVLSHNIEKEKNESHPYRTEWETAIETASTYGRNFIFPICEDKFDFGNSSIPEKIQKHNASLYDPETNNFGDFVLKIFNYLMSI